MGKEVEMEKAKRRRQTDLEVVKLTPKLKEAIDSMSIVELANFLPTGIRGDVYRYAYNRYLKLKREALKKIHAAEDLRR
ncbi:MAG: hypothetical protein QW542_05670 [Thermoproteota archaeon]